MVGYQVKDGNTKLTISIAKSTKETLKKNAESPNKIGQLIDTLVKEKYGCETA